MESLLVIGWFIWLLVSLVLVFTFVGALALAITFPQMKDLYDWPLAILAMIIYTACVLAHPFK